MRSLLIFGIVSAALLIASATQADIIIDSFGTPQSLTVTGTSATASNWVSGSDMVGGQRGVQLDLASPQKGRDTVDVAIDPSGVLDFSQGSGTGTALLVWDGRSSGSVPAVNPSGLGKRDLTQGDPNAGLAFDVLFNDLPIDLSITLYSGSNPYTSTIALPGGNVSLGSYFISYSAFPTGLDPTKVGAITLLIDGTVTAGADVTLDNLRCVSSATPEPATWVLLCLAGIGIAFRRLKK